MMWAVLLASLPQDPERARELEKQEWLRERVAKPEPVEGMAFDYGAWLRPEYYFWDDGAGIRRSVVTYDARPWVDLRNGAHTLFVRGRVFVENWSGDDAPDAANHDRDSDFDVGYYQVDLFGSNPAGGQVSRAFLRLGRLYHRWGSGLVLNGRLDGLEVGFDPGVLRVTLVGGQTPKHTDDLDTSRPNPDETRRRFYGGMIEGAFSTAFVPYAFVVAERDRNREDPEDPVQDYDWDADFWGAGARGVIGPGITFFVEGIRNGGERFSDGGLSATREDIDAWAFAAELMVPLGGSLDATAVAGYYVASGDRDRALIGSTILGNASGTDDEAFTPFGFVALGLVLNPLLANLRVYRAGVALRPVKPREVFDASELRARLDLFYYTKERPGAISDPFVGTDLIGVGREADVIVDWVVFSDLSLTLRFGYFEPAGAPLEEGPRRFFLVSVVYSY